MTVDLHRAPKTEVLGRQQVPGAEFIQVKLQRGKSDLAHSLHVAVSDDVIGQLLFELGFRKGPCQFSIHGHCFSRALDSAVDLPVFMSAFAAAREKYVAASTTLGSCGLSLSPELREATFGGFDGHTADRTKKLKQAEDESFRYVLTFVELPEEEVRGWVTHYHSRADLPLQMAAILTGVVRLDPFRECPEFDFDPCFWSYTAAHPPDLIALNANMVHDRFEQSPGRFPAGLAALAAADDALRPVGVSLAKLRLRTHRTPAPATAPPAERGSPWEYDVAISFAGPDRQLAEKLFGLLGERGVTAFYDKDQVATLWGDDLTVALDRIYREKARFCVPLVSPEYVERTWPAKELQSARARAVKETAYILPVRVGADVELPGLPPTIAYVSLREYTLEQIADLLLQKLGKDR